MRRGAPKLAPWEARLFATLAALPTAPFREQAVQTYAETVCAANGVPFFRDPLGNLVVGVASRAELSARLSRPGREPLRLFIAHMDHPGFHGLRWLARGRLAVRWHGGSPVRHLEGSALWVSDGRTYKARARLEEAVLARHGQAVARAILRVEDEGAARPRAHHLFGGFAFPRPLWRQGRRYYGRALDDLAGVFCLLATRLVSSPAQARHFIGLLTRAEEVGLLGAVGHLHLGWWQKARLPVLAVSLEASRTLPGAEIGAGPIVRLGDRRTPFDAGACQILTELAQGELDRFSRRIMDGGSCEGSAAMAFGLPTVGLAVPLGNYHHQGIEGGPFCRGHLGPAPEFVDAGDLAGVLWLARALMRPGLPWHDPWARVRETLLVRYRTQASALTQTFPR